MGYRDDLSKKLVITIASSALFDLKESDHIFRTRGEEEYRRYQSAGLDKNEILRKGIAFPFVEKLLRLNTFFKEDPIEVILLSHNSAETGLRVMQSISVYKLPITRAAFLSGGDTHPYLKSFESALFLSANNNDVEKAAEQGYPAGLVGESKICDDEDGDELRIAFDFDGVIVDDSAEEVYQKKGLSSFHQNEKLLAKTPLSEGPLYPLIKKLAVLRRFERQQKRAQKHLRISVITARNAPAHERCVRTLQELKIEPDEVFFLGGIDKGRIIEQLKPHIFFDDQDKHLQCSSPFAPSVKIPSRLFRPPMAGSRNYAINEIIDNDIRKQSDDLATEV